MNHKEICELKIIDDEKVQIVKKQMITEDIFQDMSETFKAIADKTR